MPSTYETGHLLESTSIVSVYAGSRLGARGFTRPVSLAVVRPDLVRDRELSRAFVDAAACFARIFDPNVLGVDHVLEERGKLFAVSPALTGTTLGRLIERPACRARPLSARFAQGVVRSVAEGVRRVSAALGSHGVLGGISSETVWLTGQGNVRLMPTAVCGSKLPARCRKPAVSRYRAPELDRGGPATAAADVYSLGLLLWDLVSHGRAVVPRDLDGETRSASPDVDPRIIRLSMRCLSPSPFDRPANATAFIAELVQGFDVRSGSASREQPSPSATTPSVRRCEPRSDTMEIRTDEIQCSMVHDVAKPPVRRICDLAVAARPPIPRPAVRRSTRAGSRSAPAGLGPQFLDKDGKRLRLSGAPGRWVFGRGRAADFVLLDPDMSRRHFEVVRRPDGGFRVVDLGSKNGIFLNGCRARNFDLSPGDEIQAGGTLLRFEV